jgi:predicted deacylase
MQRRDHPLLSPSLGSQRTLTSFHYGTCGARPKVTIQASLHAEELPGMLTAHHLRALLEAAEAAGNLRGEVVLIPVANPIGLTQRVDHKPMGRFELNTSENFNRYYPDLAKAVFAQVVDVLGTDPASNVTLVRAAVGDYLHQWAPETELQSLRRGLLLQSFDADFMLDLHCDCEAVLHFYTEEPCWPQFAPLAHLLGSQAILLAHNSGSGPIDECLSGLWWKLSEALQDAGKNVPLPQACCSTTIELRGEADVTHANALHDAQAVFSFLEHIAVIACDTPPEIPAALCEATPLAGSETLHSPTPGIVVFCANVGARLRQGDAVADIIDPIEGSTHTVRAGVDGVFYARIRDRYITRGGELGKIAGAQAFRTGELLGA